MLVEEVIENIYGIEDNLLHRTPLLLQNVMNPRSVEKKYYKGRQ